MCGRFVVAWPIRRVVEWFEVVEARLDALEALGGAPRYNVAPSQLVPVIVAGASGRTLLAARWGFRPPAAGPKGPAPINARAEGLGSGLFRDALRAGRAIVPANGFYEWKDAEGSG